MMQVLQRKSEEAAAATRRLKEVLEARKSTKEHASNGDSSLFLCLLCGKEWIQSCNTDLVVPPFICSTVFGLS